MGAEQAASQAGKPGKGLPKWRDAAHGSQEAGQGGKEAEEAPGVIRKGWTLFWEHCGPWKLSRQERFWLSPRLGRGGDGSQKGTGPPVSQR